MVRYLDNNSGFSQWASMHANDKPQKKSFNWLGWLILGLLAWWVLGLWFSPKTTTNVVSENGSQQIEESTLSAKQIDSNKISFDIKGLRISNIALKEHLKNSDTAENVALLDDKNNFIETGFISSDTQVPNINTKWNNSAKGMMWKNSSNVLFERQINIEDYLITISDTITNKSGKSITLVPYTHIVTEHAQNNASSVVETGGVVFANSDLDYNNWAKLDKKSYAYSTVRGSFGFADQYWEVIASMDLNDQTINMKKLGDEYSIVSNVSPFDIQAGKTTTIKTYVFAGPRISKLLNEYSSYIPGLSKTVDYGWFWFFAQPMLWMLNWLFVLVGNYGLAIILMTILLRLLIWPLTRKSYASTMAMQKLQPELQQAQKLYANDKVRLQAEMMRIYQSHKTSPMSGCLPMLIQIPIFFALYKALLISVPMRSAHFLWISDLSVMDPYFILPILMGATMWLQQILQSTKSKETSGAVASTQRVMKWMPIIFTLMFAWMPAGLVLYWTVSNLFGILQMYIIKKTFK